MGQENPSRASLEDEVVKKAAFRAAEVLAGMGYTGKYGSIHLLGLNIQTNTITAILHNLLGWQISQLDRQWVFHEKGGATPDLTSPHNEGIQIKATSDRQVKGNKVSANEGCFITVKYKRKRGEEIGVEIREIRMGRLSSQDWNRPVGTQLAILKPEGERKLRVVYP